MNKTLEKTIVGATAPTNKNVLWIDSNKNLIKYNNNNKWSVLSLSVSNNKNIESTLHEVYYYELLDLIESNKLIPNHVYKLLDYKVYLNSESPNVLGKFTGAETLGIIIYLTASSTNTFFKESRMEFKKPFFIEEFPVGDKEPVCHYSPYRTEKLPYTLFADMSSDIANLNNFYIEYETERLYKGVWQTVFSTLYATLNRVNNHYHSFKKYLVMELGNETSLKDNHTFILNFIIENPSASFAFVEGFVGDELPDDWYNYVEKDSDGNIIFSHNIYEYMMRYSKYRGEITWMRDDLGNEASYDFYSIKHYYNTGGNIPSNYIPNTTIASYINKEIPLGFLNGLDIVSANRIFFRNNKATSLLTTIYNDTPNIYVENNILDRCILSANALTCSNNIVLKQLFPVFFSGSNNFIHYLSYIAVDIINNCDISFESPYKLPNMNNCKLRGGARWLMGKGSTAVEYAEFNNPIYDTTNRNCVYQIYSKARIDGYVLNNQLAQVDRYKLGIFYVTDANNKTKMFTFKKGQTWELWLYANDYLMPSSSPYSKDDFTFVQHEGIEKVHYKGNLLKILDPYDNTLSDIYPHFGILEGEYYEKVK